MQTAGNGVERGTDFVARVGQENLFARLAPRQPMAWPKFGRPFGHLGFEMIAMRLQRPVRLVPFPRPVGTQPVTPENPGPGRSARLQHG